MLAYVGFVILAFAWFVVREVVSNVASQHTLGVYDATSYCIVMGLVVFAFVQEHYRRKSGG